METVDVSNHGEIIGALERVLASSEFRDAERSSALLRYVVEQALEGRSDRLKEYTLGVEALGRGEAFDPRTDPIVRAEASRLRARLDRYYAGTGSNDRIVFGLPKGSYAPGFFLGQRNGPASGVPVSEPTKASLEPRRPAPLHVAAWLAVACLLGGVAFFAGLALGRRRSAAPAVAFARFDVELGAGGMLGSEVGTDIVISRDGTRLAFVSKDSENVAHLGTRLLRDTNAVDLPGTMGAREPFFSPDGRWIGFWADGKLKKVAVDGGSPVVLCEATDLLGASWAEDGTIFATLNSSSVIWRIPAAGGTPVRVVDLGAAGSAPRWVQVLPGGKQLLYTTVRGATADRAETEVVSLQTGERKVIARGGTFARYLSSGHLAYVNQGSLFVAPFDLRRLEVRATAAPVLDGISYSPSFGYAQIAFSETGTVVYRKAVGSGQAVAAWVDSTGGMTPFVDVAGRYISPHLAPDGRRLAMSVVDGGILTLELYEQDSRGTRAHRVPRGTPSLGLGLWTPNGKFVIATDAAATGLSWFADSGAPHQLITGSTPQVPWSFTPRGDRLAYHEMDPKSAFDLWTVPIRADENGLHAGKPEIFLRTPAYEVYPAFSPDGHWLAYSSNVSGSWQVYVRHFPDDGTASQVSKGGGRVPRWSPNGRELFYATDDQRLMVVSYSMHGQTFASGSPRQWTPLRFADTGVLPNYDLANDGRRVLALVAPGASLAAQRQNQATVIVGFYDELRRRGQAPVP